MKKHLTTALLLLAAMCIPSLVQAKDWIDVTNAYITNPSFENNDLTTGWKGTGFGSANPFENAEHYSREFDSYQELTGLRSGQYRLTLSAFYRRGSASDDYNAFNSSNMATAQLAVLYATTTTAEFSTPICLASSAALPQSLGGAASMVGNSWGWDGGGQQLFIPNNMEAAYYWFEAGYYKNEVTNITVSSDGKLTIGIRKAQTFSGDWVCLDNWKLEYYGDKIDVTSLKLNHTALTLQQGEEIAMKATITPSNATIKTITWTSTDESVATVDQSGNVQARGAGECEIIVTAKDGSNVTARCKITVERNAVAPGTLIINEIMSRNVDSFLDPSYNFGGWVEIYNPTNKAISLANYYYSDDPSNLMKWHLAHDLGAVPAHGFKNLWFGHNDRYHKDYQQVNDKLDCDGGTVYLSDDEGNLIASQEYPAGIDRASWARLTDGSNEWGWTSTPTPEASNYGIRFCTEQLAAPEVNANGTLFNSGETIDVRVTIPSGTTLRYTTNGTTPTLTNGEESQDGHFAVSATTVYRWRLFEDGKLPSPVTTRSFILRDKNYTLPVVSVVTDAKNITGSTYGVDVSGSGNGRSGNGTSSNVNFNMDWDRPVSFEFIEQEPRVNSEGYFQQEADFSISGGWSRKQTPRSFKIKASKQYGLNSLDYPFFTDMPYNKTKALLFRNGGNDGHAHERLKDGAINEIVKRSGLVCDLQDWQPCHIFINGKYRGMQNMRQPSNKHLGYNLYGIDTDEIDAFEISVDSGYCQMSGTREAFDEWYELAQDAADEENWKRLCELVDMDEYCNFMAVQLNLQNWDWPHNNHKGFRERREGGKFHMVLFDVDNVFEQNIGNPFQRFESDQYYTFYPIFEWNNQQLRKEVEPVTIFLGMLQNDEFRKKMIDTYCLVNGSVFEPQRCAEIIDELANYISTPMGLEGYSSNVRSRANTMKGNFSSSRQANAIKYIKDYWRMGLSNQDAQQVSISSNIPEGRILLNGMNIPTGKFEGGLFSPITLKAEAPAGFKFLGWQNSGAQTFTTSLIKMKENWEYYADGSLDNANWKANTNSVDWKTGQAPFGYGSSSSKYMQANSNTHPGSSSDKKLCIYFHKTFQLDEQPASDDVFRFHYIVDDGFRLHINGRDVGGYHSMEGDKYADNTESHNGNWYEGETPAEGVIEIPASFFMKGTNHIALDVHNCNNTSSDFFFDGSLERVSQLKSESGFISSEAEIEMPESGDHNFVAVFAEETDEDILLASGNVPVKVNEVSAGNSVNVNDYFKKDDWIELYNNTNEDIDIAGMYLSDKAKNPLKYQIPGDIDGLNTIIPARGHLVVWASKRDIIGREIHTNFKLDNEDDAMVILTAADETWSDTLRYDAHEGQESFGRYPDGGQHIFHMTTPTIAAQNKLSYYSQLAYTYIYTGIASEEEPSEPDAILLASGDIKKVEYINASGMLMGSSRENLRPGIYVVRHHMADGTVITRKQNIR